MKCKLCGSEKSKLLFKGQHRHGSKLLSSDIFPVSECCSCNVCYVDVVVNDDYYKKYYPDTYYPDIKYNFFMEKILSLLHKVSFNNRLSLIQKYAKQGNKILEIGCARGEFLNFLPKKFKKFGIEINSKGFEYIKKNYDDIAVFQDRLDDPSFKNNKLGKFDVIIMWHVFEHIENPSIFVKNLSTLLSKDGVIIFDIPNRDSLGFKFLKNKWFHLDAPCHLFHYNYKSIKKLMQSNNLEIIRFKGNLIDYYQDLSSSIYLMLKTYNNYLNLLILISILPSTMAIRFIVSLFFPKCSELNTYVVQREKMSGTHANLNNCFRII